MKNKKISIFLLSTGLLLASCGRVTLKDVKTADSEIQKSQTEIIETINNTQKLESKMSEDFADSIQEKEIKNISKPSSPAYKNIEERREHLKEIENQQNSFNKQLKVLDSYDDKTLNQKMKTSYLKALTDLNKSLDSYRKHYEENIKLQEDYFKTISSKDAKPEEFIDGLNEINADYTDLQAELKEINNQLQKLDELHMNFEKELEKSLEKGNK